MDHDHIDVLARESHRFSPSTELSAGAHIGSEEEYAREYQRSIEDPEGFWGEKASEYLDWYKSWDKVLQWDFDQPSIKWFDGGKLNVAANCLDRHVAGGRAGKTALIWEGDGGDTVTFTYAELLEQVELFASLLKSRGIEKGDRVTLYLPMIPELPISMLACARIGAIHNVVFGGFSAHSLRDRINDCEPKLVVTADEGVRGGKPVPLKIAVDEALETCPSVESVIVVRRTGNDGVTLKDGRDFWWADEMARPGLPQHCPPEVMDSESPLFILYTSGSTGKPKGVLHTSAGYLLYAAMTFKLIFDYHEDDVHFCTADIGWITGHSYLLYGPLAVGATTVMFEGVPTYPAPDRFWEIVEKHKATIIYTAPTVIRALMREGSEWTERHDLSSLRVLGSVGEPINPEAWLWYHRHVGKGRLPVVDTWWQTETGGILISPLPGAMTLKPGSASRPFFGVVPKVICEGGEDAATGEGGYLVIQKPWPGMLRGTYGDPTNQRVKDTYFTQFPGYYLTGDGAHIDEDGDFWLAGRIDDVVNVSGHRLSTAEVESALVSHPAVAEAAVVGFPHDLKGEGIAAYVVLREGHASSPALEAELCKHVRAEIGPIATPDQISLVDGLPKTRSGKIMRRILRKITCGATDELGDTSTLADPSVVQQLLDLASAKP